MAYYNTMMTDTGSGGNRKIPIATPTTSSTSSTSTSTTAKKPTSNTTSAATQPTQQTENNNSEYTYNYSSSGGSGGGGSEEPEFNYDNYKRYLQLQNKLIENQYSGEKNQAVAYKDTANANSAKSEAQWKSAYDQIADYLNQLEQGNAQREATINNAINTAYNNLIGNANTYYQSVLDAYNRSMGYVDQGYNEGKEAAQMSKDEAIRLAQALYDMEAENQQRQTEKDLKSQYISYMNNMKNVNQALAAQGINGGASETALLGALNGYEANRTSLDEARLAALGALRQTQMQSDSAAEQSYLSALQNLISQRTQNQLGVENTRASGETNYANMKNDAENTRSNQTLQAQQAFQNWASDLVNQRSGNESNYANAIQNIMTERNNTAQAYAQMVAQALGNRTNNAMSSAYQNALGILSEGGRDADLLSSTSNTTNKQRATKVLNGTSLKTYSSQSAAVQKEALAMAYRQVTKGKLKIADIKDKDLKKAVQKKVNENKKKTSTAKKASTSKKK